MKTLLPFLFLAMSSSLYGGSLISTALQSHDDDDVLPNIELGSDRILDLEILSNRPKINWKDVPAISFRRTQSVKGFSFHELRQALDDLFSEDNIRTWFLEEQWLAFHQTLLLEQRCDELLHLSDLLDYMDIWPDENDSFYIQYFAIKDQLEMLSPTTRRSILRGFYQDLAVRLKFMSQLRRRWNLSFNQLFNWDSNVNQMPEGEPLISQISGLSSQSELIGRITSKDGVYGQTQLEAGVLLNRYEKAILKDRDYETYKVNVDHQFLMDGPIALGAVTMDIRYDVLNLNNIKEHHTTSWIPGFNLISRPKKVESLSWIDNITGVSVLYLEKRSYHGKDRLDQSGKSKDLFASHLNLIAIAQTKTDYGKIFSSFSLGYRDQNSDSTDLSYQLYHLGLGFQWSTASQGFLFDLRFSERHQKNYQTFKRHDRTLDLDLTYERKLPWSGLAAQFKIGHTKQNSNLNLMPFENQHLSLGGMWNY